MIKIITLILAVSFLYQCPAHLQQKQESRSEELTINTDLCKSVTSTFRWRLGSDKIVIKGRNGNKCDLTLTSEVEGGYRVRECSIPLHLKEFKISVERQSPADSATEGDSAVQGVRYSPDISEYCTVVKTGNRLEELKRTRKS